MIRCQEGCSSTNDLCCCECDKQCKNPCTLALVIGYDNTDKILLECKNAEDDEYGA